MTQLVILYPEKHLCEYLASPSRSHFPLPIIYIIIFVFIPKKHFPFENKGTIRFKFTIGATTFDCYENTTRAP